jgi:hypothetical protein
MAISYECPDCHTRWPHSRSYGTCPECRVPCRSASVPRVLTAGQAKSRLRQIEFVKYYEAREKFRDGPTPEEIGAAEAREEARRIRELNEALNDEDPGD